MNVKLWTILFVLLSTINFTKLKDPETDMPVPEIISYNGYPSEEHLVTTSDGYILTLHRIPHARHAQSSPDQPVIFLQHGLLCSSADWVVNPRADSLAFMLADAGFDVWLGNSRGNTYSKMHTTFSVDSDQFWDFSWDDMANEDLPAVVNFITQVTKQEQIYYVGHSQGTMIAFAELSRNAQLASKIKRFYGLAPVAYLGNTKTPLKYLTSFLPEIKWLYKIFGMHQFLPQTHLIDWLASHMCTKSIVKEACANVVFIICGYDKPQMNETRLDVYMTHSPAGTSVKNIIHYEQMYQSKKFQMYDYGEDENMIKYGQSYPPAYNASNFHISTVLYSGGNDWLADNKDVEILLKSLPPGVVKSHKNIESWMHLDFIWGMDAATEVYNHLIADALKHN